MPGDVPERQFASAEGVVIFILWQQDENGHQFFKPHPGPLQDRTLVAPPFVDLLRRQAPSRSDAVGSPRPENAFRLDILLRRSDEDELGHTTNSRVPALIYEALVYGLNNGYYANGSGPCITSSSLPTCVSKTASGSQTIAVPAGSKFYKSGNIRELYVGYERELKVKPGVYVWSWVERTRIQGQLDVIQFEVCSEDDQGKEKVLSLCRIIIQEYQRPAQLASL
ncbi:hypothetical protein BGX31_009543 [Mortierella sp. GBA43]|nr:hypothetical protein BGX31_009543 [Mortierella sp. GBA43]